MKRRTKERLGDVLMSVAAIGIGLLIAFPVFYCILSAFKTPAEFKSAELLPESFGNLENFENAMNQAPLLRYMLNSFIMALGGTVVRLMLAVLAAYALAYFEFHHKNLIFYLILGTMMIPADTLLVTNYITVSEMGLLNNYLGMIIVSFASASQMFMLRQKFMSVPKDLRNAAMLDGCGDLRYIRKILLPVCRPVLVTLFVQSFIALWNAYLWPLMVTAGSADMRTIMVGITKLNSWEDTNYELVLAGVTISLIPSFIMFLAMRRSMDKGGTDGSLVG